MALATEIDWMQEDVLASLPLPITLQSPSAMTDEDLIALSGRNRPLQIECNSEGELEIMSPPGAQGSHWEAEVIFELGLWTRSNGGMFFSSNGGFRLPNGSMRSPDAAWVSNASWKALSKAQQRVYAPLCPEFIVEILSATDSRKRLEAKMAMWIAKGARMAWMIDPYAATVSIYRPGSMPEVLERPEWVEAATVVPGFRLAMSRLWAK